MCLLVSQPAIVNFSDAFLLDVYAKNEDGLGVMYAADGKLHVYKCLPANGQDFVDFYRAHGANRDCIWHARMKTHGDIDMENCHPYRVTDDIWLAHNGVLSTSNDADRSKSDTWHFIKNVLRPALSHDPDLMLDKEWVTFMGGVIGSSNKFGLLRADGKSCVINRKSGVEFQNSWLSNTYAWTPSRFGFRTNHGPVFQGGYVSHYQNDDFEYRNSWMDKQIGWSGNKSSWPKVNNVIGLADDQEDDFEIKTADQNVIRKYVRAAYNQWTRHGLAGIEQWVYDAPEKAANVLAFWYEDLESYELLDLVRKDPDEAAVWIEDLFATDAITPSWLG